MKNPQDLKKWKVTEVINAIIKGLFLNAITTSFYRYQQVNTIGHDRRRMKISFTWKKGEENHVRMLDVAPDDSKSSDLAQLQTKFYAR